MKIRRGFVSNSSSSSFVVVFNRDELSIDYLKEVLYGDAESVPYTYNWGDECEEFTTNDLCSAIINTMERADTMDQLMGAFDSMSNYDNPRLPEFPGWDNDCTPEERKKIWEQYDVDRIVVVKELIAEFQAELKVGDHVFIGEFSDNEGSMHAHLEHGGTFDSVKSIRISNH